MDGVKMVQGVQEYIFKHYQEEWFNMEEICKAVGCSRRQVDRLFKEYLNTTLSAYIKAVCLTKSATELCNEKKSITEIAFDNRFDSHEGFSRAFSRRFHILPSQYRESKIAIPLFVQYPINHYYVLLKHKEATKMDNNSVNICTVTAKERTRRKLIYLSSHQAQDYLSYCEEVGCEWEGLLNSISEKYEKAALIELPEALAPKGFSKIAAGVEVPFEYDKCIPKGYKIMELPECIMLYFQTEPYEDEENFCYAIGNAYAAIEKYNPTTYGYQFAYDIAPSFNFGASAKTGAMVAVPVIKL